MKRLYRLYKEVPFKQKLIVYSLLLSVGPVLILGMVSSYIAARSVQEEVNRNHRIVLTQVQYQVDMFLRNLDKSALQLATNPTIKKSVELRPSMENLDSTLDMISTFQANRSYSDINYDISLFYKRFGVVYSTRYGLTEISQYPYRYVIESVKTKYNASVVVPPNTFPKQEDLLLLRPVPLSKAFPDGLIILHVGPHQLSSFVDQIDLGEGRKLLVVDDSGRIVISSDIKEIGTRLPTTSELYRYWSNPKGFNGFITLGGVDYHLSSQKALFNNWTYIAMIPVREFTIKSDHIKEITWQMVLLLTTFWVVLAVIGSRRMYLPIQRLLKKFSPEVSAAHKHEDGLKMLDTVILNMMTVNHNLKKQLNEQLPYLKDSVLTRLLWGEMKDSEIREKMEYYGFSLKGKWVCVCVAEVDEWVKFQQRYCEKDRSFILYTLRIMIEEICNEIMPCVTISPRPGQVALIISLPEANDMTDRKIRDMAKILREKVKQHFSFTVTVAIGGVRKHLRNISESYEECLALLDYRLLLGPNATISKQDIKPPIKQSSHVLLQLQKQMVSNVAEGNYTKARQHLSQMIELLPDCVQHSETALGLFAHLLGEFEGLIEEMGYALRDFLEGDLYKELYQMNSLAELEAWFADVIFPAIQRKEGLNVSKQTRIIQQVVMYIQKHYDQDLSLQLVAERFHLSPSQLSRAFKEETGQNFVDYLIHYRMQKAKEWLVHTDLPIKEIASRLRYTTVQNFTRIFKRVTGVPPGQYRKKAQVEYQENTG